MSIRQIQSPWLSDVLTTTDATVTASAACTAAIPSGAVGFLELTVTARNTTTGAGATIRMMQAFKNVSATLTLATAVTVIALNGDATFVAALLATPVTFVVSGTSVQPKVTGVIATNIEWLLDARYTIH
jgi:hypothetical protein